MIYKKNIYFDFFSLAPTGSGLSGSDRIFIELARNWSVKNLVKIYTTQEGVEMCGRQGLSGKYLVINKIEKNQLPYNFFLKYLYKIYLGIKLGITLNIGHKSLITDHYIYSSSDFWMDVIPCVILKIRYPKLKWVATWYQTAPNPFKGYSEGIREEKYNFSAFLYWFSQLPIKPLIRKYADFVIVNNEEERKQFSKMNNLGKVIVLLGAVRLDDIENWKLKIGNILKIYDAVFMGRFHPQKGVVELIDIWRKVVDEIPNAKLAMIGDGPLMKKVKSQITNFKLHNNIKLFGYLFDGPEKYRIFAQSKIVVHPAFYDSGGMASAEAMAFELPAIGFNLKAFDSYYSKGMIKVKGINEFADTICEILKNNNKRKIFGKAAYNMIVESYTWESRGKEIYSYINK